MELLKDKTGSFKVGDLTVVVNIIDDRVTFLGLMIGDGAAVRFRLSFLKNCYYGMCDVYHQGKVENGQHVVAGCITTVNPDEHLTSEYRTWINKLNS